MSFTQEFVAVPISLALYRQVLERHPMPHGLIEDVVADFLDRTAEAPTVARKGRGTGVLWEALLLPEKTRLRTKHHREYKYAEVKGDHVAYEGERFPSVAAAINRMRGDTSNNAWNVTQVMRPSDTEWLSALRVRKHGGGL